MKEKSFRFDRIFYPPNCTQPIYFIEVQFQKKLDFYWAFFAEIAMYLDQYQPPQQWKAVGIFNKRSYDPEILLQYEEFFLSGRIIPIYLDEITANTESLALGVIQLVIENPINAINLAKKLLVNAQTQSEILKLIETVLVYKFPKLIRQEIEAMFTLTDLQQTKVYQEARQEGRQEGEQLLILRIINIRFGKLSDRLSQSIQNLNITPIEELADRLLEFKSLSDLENWLHSYLT